MPKNTIINGLQHLQNTWSPEDKDFPFNGIPDCVAGIVRTKMDSYNQILSGRLLLEHIIPPDILKRFQTKKIDSFEDMNFDLKNQQDEETIFSQVAFKQILDTADISERDLKIIISKYTLGLTDEELSNRFGLSRSYTNMLLHKIIKKLKEQYDEQE